MEKEQESAEIKRLQGKLTTDVLWLYILKLLLKESIHGYALRARIREEFGFSIGEVTSYVVLYKLKQRGFVKTEQQENKAMYSITPEGKKLFTAGKKEWGQRAGQLFGFKRNG